MSFGLTRQRLRLTRIFGSPGAGSTTAVRSSTAVTHTGTPSTTAGKSGRISTSLSVVRLSRATMPLSSDSLDMTGRLSPFCGERITLRKDESWRSTAYSRSGRRLVCSGGSGGSQGERHPAASGCWQGADLGGVGPLDVRRKGVLEVPHVVTSPRLHLHMATA